MKETLPPVGSVQGVLSGSAQCKSRLDFQAGRAMVRTQGLSDEQAIAPWWAWALRGWRRRPGSFHVT